jgi:hypothetical protein
MNRVFNGLKAYLTDWKNLLTHSVIGIFLLWFAVFAPISPYIRIGVLAAVVTFNVIRMKYSS